MDGGGWQKDAVPSVNLVDCLRARARGAKLWYNSINTINLNG